MTADSPEGRTLYMRFAYLILAHRDLQQVGALVARLFRDDPDDIVILHVDRESAITDAELDALAAAHSRSRLLIAPRIACRWGHHSLIEAVIVLMQALDGIDYDHAHLISGQDWPVCDKATMIGGIETDACYVTLAPEPMAERMDDYHFHARLIERRQPSFGVRLWRKALAMAGEAWTFTTGARRCPFGPVWQRGSAWWSVPREAADFLKAEMLALLASGRLRHTLCSDEHVPQTIIAYSRFAGRIQPNRRFIVWNGGASPARLGAADLPAIEGSGCWFARKVDRDHDPFFAIL